MAFEAEEGEVTENAKGGSIDVHRCVINDDYIFLHRGM